MDLQKVDSYKEVNDVLGKLSIVLKFELRSELVSDAFVFENCSIWQETINEQELSVNNNLKSQNNDLRFEKLPFNLDQGQ